jgi:hypothetical protein
LALKPLRSAAASWPTAGSRDDPALPDAAQKLVLADHCPRRLNQRHQHVQGGGAEPYRPAGGQDPETAELRHRGRGQRSELWAMVVIYIFKEIEIYIFKENHRFSD